MHEYEVCLICAADATQRLANSPVLPLCDNFVCEVALTEEINKQLEAAEMAAS